MSVCEGQQFVEQQKSGGPGEFQDHFNTSTRLNIVSEDGETIKGRRENKKGRREKRGRIIVKGILG